MTPLVSETPLAPGNIVTPGIPLAHVNYKAHVTPQVPVTPQGPKTPLVPETSMIVGSPGTPVTPFIPGTGALESGCDPLSLLPGEVLSLICLRLDLASLGSLEQCSKVIYQKIQASGVWRRRVEQRNALDPFQFVTGMLSYVRQRQLIDSRVFKIIGGSRKMIEVTVDIYQRQFLPPSDAIKTQATLDIRKILRDKSIEQLKALCRMHLMMEETEYPVLTEHKALFHRIFNPHHLDVANSLKHVSKVIEKLSFVNQLTAS